MCQCKNIIPQSQECYNRMITLDIPPHMKAYRDNRIKAGLGGRIAIDPCIYDEMCELWEKGIHTRGCCCGHNLHKSFVNVAKWNIEQMLELGYTQEHLWDKERKDTFILQSV